MSYCHGNEYADQEKRAEKQKYNAPSVNVYNNRGDII